MRTSRHCNRLTAPAGRFLTVQPAIPAFIESALVRPRAA